MRERDGPLSGLELLRVQRDAAGNEEPGDGGVVLPGRVRRQVAEDQAEAVERLHPGGLAVANVRRPGASALEHLLDADAREARLGVGQRQGELAGEDLAEIEQDAATETVAAPVLLDVLPFGDARGADLVGGDVAQAVEPDDPLGLPLQVAGVADTDQTDTVGHRVDADDDVVLGRVALVGLARADVQLLEERGDRSGGLGGTVVGLGHGESSWPDGLKDELRR